MYKQGDDPLDIAQLSVDAGTEESTPETSQCLFGPNKNDNRVLNLSQNFIEKMSDNSLPVDEEIINVGIKLAKKKGNVKKQVKKKKEQNENVDKAI